MFNVRIVNAPINARIDIILIPVIRIRDEVLRYVCYLTVFYINVRFPYMLRCSYHGDGTTYLLTPVLITNGIPIMM